MSEHIERDKAIEILRKHTMDDGWIEEQEVELVAEINNIPAADVQPVKHGQWILDNPQYLLARCSECQCFNSIGYKWKYCPNCGARMDGET